ncbi:MAG: diacylglycerol kinase family protein [Planctomycetota bacterium]
MNRPPASDEPVTFPPKRRGVWRVLHSFRYAGAGLRAAWRTQLNLRVHVMITLLVVTVGIGLGWSSRPLGRLEWAALFICIGLVIALELTNTAIEVTVDLVCPQPDPRAKLAKDAAAGAVLVMAIASAGVGVLIFAPRLWVSLIG